MENFLQGTLLKNFRTTHGAELFTVEKFHEQIVDGTTAALAEMRQSSRLPGKMTDKFDELAGAQISDIK